MRSFAIIIFVLGAPLNGSSFHSIEYPSHIHADSAVFSRFKPQRLHCKVELSHSNPFGDWEASSCDDETSINSLEHKCADQHVGVVRIKNAGPMIGHHRFEFQDAGPCPVHPYSKDTIFLPHPHNCSLFYKCDWGSAILFECPTGLHFNPALSICNWPWKANCDDSWIGCPRPEPRCPLHYTRQTQFLPHPRLCDRFYQCDWGLPILQKCPTGLYFNSRLKLCDWPYNSECQVC